MKGGRLEACEKGECTGEKAKHRYTGPVSRDGAASGLVDLCGYGWKMSEGMVRGGKKGQLKRQGLTTFKRITQNSERSS